MLQIMNAKDRTFQFKEWTSDSFLLSKINNIFRSQSLNFFRIETELRWSTSFLGYANKQFAPFKQELTLSFISSTVAYVFISLSLSLSSYTHTLCYFQNNNSGFSSVNFIKLFSVSSFPTLSHVQSISLSITLSSCLLYPFALLSCVGTQTLFQ